MEISSSFWIGFNAFILAMLALDLGVFHRKGHTVTLRESLAWTAVWIALALLFNGLIYYQFGQQLALEFLTGYVIEKSLSIDNVFVFLMLFSLMRVPRECEHKVLFWGVLGALVMRAVMIFAGVALLERFHWLMYVFGALLIVTGLKMLRPAHLRVDVEALFVTRLMRRFVRMTPQYEGDRFVVRRDGKLWATPLLLVLVLVESSDLVFAVDSIPAILAVSENPFIVYTSNVFAILGLRSLYFALAGVVSRFEHLKYGLCAVLCFVGLKMILADIVKVPIVWSLAFIGIAIGASVVSSLWSLRKQERGADLQPVA